MYALFKPDLLELARVTYQQHALFESDGISVEELNAIQLDRLRQTLRYVNAHSPFYRDLLSASDAALSTLDWHAFRQLPFTTKDDLRTAGHFMLSAPLSDAWIYYETTGTTGAATPCPRNERDSIFNNTPLILRYEALFQAHGERHIVGVMGPTELHSTGDTFEDVCRSLGHTVVKMWPRSPVVGMERVITLIRELKISALVCTPAVAISLARHLINKGQNPSALGVKLIFTLGELTTPGLLRNIGDVWGSAVYNCMYASQESSILAACDKQGHLCTVPLNVVYEVVNPITGEVLEPKDGQMTGELVITHLYQGQKPLIRYRTGDTVRARVLSQGKWQIIPIGRLRDTLVINGRNHCAYDVEAALFEHLTGCLDYHIQVETVSGIDKLSVIIELQPNSEARNDLNTVARYMETALGVPVSITVGPTDAVTGTAAMVSWKAARLHDKRTGGDNLERDTALKIAARRA
ncbi:phenylacetate--CoA ligase family protein [Pseudomonas syringae]|uniref:phenylacetate--CoA ligase family protein n=1 Tax=Pseudomonas syringae TaxID=317 RepID=UPI000352148C|nr:AMP-binding protein [Pseudomonas syringae]EPF65285.1 Phenylacetate-coenzyme A ligase [Pseudomonas syringae pv. syringae SM]MBS7412046.1 phenylacetate--CoA ligase family protein [Pseudomonas syringae]OBS41584.1 CoF synthetase [Pseudomonas syringae pv. syringae]QVI76531.1 phenylacetate--CoA ligase family protein [Pseudomonas syringae]